MSASDSIQVAFGCVGKLSVQRTVQRPQVSSAFNAITTAGEVGRLHRLGPGSAFDMPKTTASTHRYVPYLQQVTALLN